MTQKPTLLAKMLYCLPTGPNTEVQHIYLQSIYIKHILPYATIIRHFKRKTYPTTIQNTPFLGTNFINEHNLCKRGLKFLRDVETILP